MAWITVRSSGSTAGMRDVGAAGGDRVHVHRQEIDAVRGLARGVVGVAQADGVAVGVRAHAEHGELVDERPARIGHAADADPADHRGVHPGAADLLADPFDDQAVHLVERQPRDQRFRDFEQALGGGEAVGLAPWYTRPTLN